jgi:hypothetical protein
MTADPSVAAGDCAQARADQRRNFVLGVLNGAIFKVTMLLMIVSACFYGVALLLSSAMVEPRAS